MPPWILLGAVAVLFPIFAYITYENIDRQKESSIRLLLEKGAALMRSFEAGTRTGVMGTHWNSFKLQHLLSETARQSDIRYLAVTDPSGRVVVHSDPQKIGSFHGAWRDLSERVQPHQVTGHVVRDDAGHPVFEVIGRFSPAAPPWELPPGEGAVHRRFQELMRQFSIREAKSWIMFVGLDMAPIEAARQADMRHTIVVGAVLLLIGFTGIVLLMLFQGYRNTRSSLSRIKAFSDNLVETMPIGLVALDTEKRIASLNQAASRLFGLPVSDAMEKQGARVLPDALREVIDALDRRSDTTDRQIDCVLSDGRMLPLEVTTTVLMDESGLFFGFAVLIKDLSELEALRKVLARSQRLATVGRLAAGVAHEIRNPLSSIKGFATYFKQRYPDAAEDQQIAGIMIQEVDKLNRVVGQLLEFARPVQVTPRWTQVTPLIDDALKLVEQQAAEAQITVRSTVTPPDLQAMLDAHRIHQVLLNLFLNALDAMGPGGSLNVRAETSPDKREMIIRVADTGTGIAPEDLAHIFDPYFTTKPAGTGLGLAIVHNIAEAHHGRINAESDPHGGTVMTLRLPQPDPNAPQPERSATP